jgi:hypothetical protein
MAPAWVGLLVWALLSAQWLGMVHRVLHVPVSVQLVAPSAPALQHRLASGATNPADALAGVSAPSGVLAHLAGTVKSEQDCRLYDQLGLSEALKLVPPLWVAEVFRSDVRVCEFQSLPAQALRLAARGPPLNS